MQAWIPKEGGSIIDPALRYVRNLKLTGVPDVNTGHSAAFSNDGETLIFGHEPSGGTRARCQKTRTRSGTRSTRCRRTT